MIHDLLHEPLIRSDIGRHSLPGLMAAMAQGEISSFPALRPHQRPAWHMFLVQLAVLALDATDHRELPESEGEWRGALSALTTEFPGGEPWHLVVPDRSLPAFLQPPDPGGLKDWRPVATPDALDMLITARNHDVKVAIAHEATPEDWIFALVSLQTMEGYGGPRNYGIARMNGAFSSRAMLALAPARAGSAQIDSSAWWRRDVEILLSTDSFQNSAGKRLVWLESWVQGQMLELSSLHPLFIEICRRIRLNKDAGRVMAERNTSTAERINAKDAAGNTGDPWAPVHLADGKGLSLGERDWTHNLLVDLLFSKKRAWKVPLLARHHAQETVEPMLLIAGAFSRGKSRTDGFRFRVVPVPKAAIADLFGEKAVSVAEQILADIAAIDQALRNALALVAAGGDRKRKLSREHYARSRAAREALERQADEIFFPELWARMAVTDDEGFASPRLKFLERLSKIARHEFRAALPAIPCASLMRPRAEVRGRQLLESGLRRAVAKLKKPEAVHG